jgi:hypothetical protein
VDEPVFTSFKAGTVIIQFYRGGSQGSEEIVHLFNVNAVGTLVAPPKDPLPNTRNTNVILHSKEELWLRVELSCN